MKLSIIVPVYNVENYLSACLDSLIYPELTDYEIIIVNDGSTDASLSVAEEYAQKCPSLIRIITQENGGLGAARNTGIEHACGEYLLFIDSDDTLAPGAVKEMYSRLDEDFDICIFGILSVNENGEEVNQIPLCTKDGIFSLDTYPELLLSAHSACNKLFRRSLFTDTGIRFPGRVWYEDMRTTPKLYLYAPKITTDQRRWYVYLQRSGSITNSANIEKNLQIIDAVDDLVDYYKTAGAYEKYKKELEYSAFYNQFLTASIRVCIVDPSHSVVNKLRDDFLAKFPDYKQNPYVKTLPMKHKLLAFLLMHSLPHIAGAIMKLNNSIKNKNT